jgi:hypothetical protein
MRPQKRSRGRNGGGNPYHNNNQNRGPRPPHRSQTFDSNGPNVKIRGNAYQVFERYLALAREAQSAGDRIAAENFYQHAEHYFRVMSAQGESFQAQQRQHQHQMSVDGEMSPNGEGDPLDDEQPSIPEHMGQQHMGQPMARGHHGHENHGHDDPQPSEHHAQVHIERAPPPPPEPMQDDDQLPLFITGRPD